MKGQLAMAGWRVVVDANRNRPGLARAAHLAGAPGVGGGGAGRFSMRRMPARVGGLVAGAVLVSAEMVGAAGFVTGSAVGQVGAAHATVDQPNPGRKLAPHSRRDLRREPGLSHPARTRQGHQAGVAHTRATRPGPCQEWAPSSTGGPHLRATGFPVPDMRTLSSSASASTDPRILNCMALSTFIDRARLSLDHPRLSVHAAS